MLQELTISHNIQLYIVSTTRSHLFLSLLSLSFLLSPSLWCTNTPQGWLWLLFNHYHSVATTSYSKFWQFEGRNIER
ncbi:hypothetical protein GBAR_LOCUS24601 [Geodia barretti]|uniref:Uncharacterized protein n=1 Tax=Geodia barretti TaxID=519541 RepID=A0AA35TCD5_GEOBA|nr:hypothetical protein GBAR_LOCUS24601 [Geodia barretti]